MPETRQAFSQWQSLDPMGQQSGGVPGSASKTYPLVGDGPEPWFRDRLDEMRSARIPTAEYPDGYLGTVKSRRQDRLQAAGGSARLTQKHYQRGVHVGARVDPQSYFWQEDTIHPMAGLVAQAEGRKWAPTGNYVETKLTNDGKPMPRGAPSLVDESKKTLNNPRLAPRWK